MNGGSIDRIRKDVEQNYATCYWSEDGRTKLGWIPREKTIEPMKFLERVVRACKRDFSKNKRRAK